METVKVLNSKYSKETFTVVGKMDMTGLENIVAELEANGWEPCYYILERVVTGRKKAYRLEACMKSVKYGTYQA